MGDDNSRDFVRNFYSLSPFQTKKVLHLGTETEVARSGLFSHRTLKKFLWGTTDFLYRLFNRVKGILFSFCHTFLLLVWI